MSLFQTVLIGAATTAIGTFFQNRSYDYQSSVGQSRAELGAAKESSDLIGGMVAKRLYTMRRLYWAMKFPERISPEDMGTRWATHQSVLIEWNSQLLVKIGHIQLYFGHYMAEVFENEIQPRFRLLNDKIVEMYFDKKARTDEAYETWQEQADGLNEIIRAFNFAMLEAIQKGDVGLLRKGGRGVSPGGGLVDFNP